MSEPDRQEYDPRWQSSILSFQDVRDYFANRGKKNGGGGGAVLITDTTINGDVSGAARVRIWNMVPDKTLPLYYVAVDFANFEMSPEVVDPETGLGPHTVPMPTPSRTYAGATIYGQSPSLGMDPTPNFAWLPYDPPPDPDYLINTFVLATGPSSASADPKPWDGAWFQIVA